MEQIRLNPSQAILFLTLVGVGVGILLGLIPLILGIRRKKTRLGVYGLICSIIGGAISSILSLIIVGIFIWLILKKSGSETNSDFADASGVGEFDAKNSGSEVSDSKVSDSEKSDSLRSDIS